MTQANDHRRSFRLDHPGVACIHWASWTRRYAVGNLSLGGVLLLGAPAPGIGARVSARVRMRGIRPLALDGRVVREERAGVQPAFALRFTHLSSEAEDAIHDLWLVKRDRTAAPMVLLVARSAQLREVLSEFLERLGWSVVTAATPLEAIDQLERLADNLCWVVALQHLTQTTGESLLSFAGHEYPGIRRLLICPPSARRMDRVAVRHGVAEAAILQPINPVDVATVLGPRKPCARPAAPRARRDRRPG